MAEALKVQRKKKFDGPAVRMRKYNGKIEPQATLACLWKHEDPRKAKDGWFKGNVLTTVKHGDFSFPRRMKVGLKREAPPAEGGDQEYTLYFNRTPVAVLEERQSEKGDTYLMGVCFQTMELNSLTHVVEDVRFLAFRPHPDSAAAKKNAKWNIKVTGLQQDDPDAEPEDDADTGEGEGVEDEETPFTGGDLHAVDGGTEADVSY